MGAFDIAATPVATDALQLASRRPVVLYGAGGFGGRALVALRAAGHGPVAFVDGKKSAPGAMAHGLPVFDPWHWQGPCAQSDATLVISLFNPGVPIGVLKRRLQAAGWSQVIDPFELIVALGPDCGLDTYWLTHPRSHSDQRTAIEAGATLFDDDASRALYRVLAALREHGDFARLPAPTTHDVYVPDGLPELGARVRMLDCGAYVGDTMDDLIGKGIDLAEVVAFEPDPRNFARLASTAARHAATGLRTTLFPCGLSERLEVLRFASGSEASSAVDAAGTDSALCVAIDEVLPEFPASFIKMDIEGSEASALRGAARLIARHRPRLAVSAYHRPDDLWQLPALVRSIRPDYRLYLRCHAYNGFETVLYAV